MSDQQPSPGRQSVLDRYQAKLDTHRATVKRCDQRWSSVGYLRGGLFLMALVPIFLCLTEFWGIGRAWLYLSGLLFFGFLAVAYIHEGMQRELRRASLLVKVYRESLARCHRDWKEIQTPTIELERRQIPLSNDLDLFTESSIFKLLGITRTPLGTSTLKAWILDGALADEVKLRQDAVKELSPQIDWRESFQLTCEQLSVGQSGPSRFVQWATSESWFAGRHWILGLARLTSVVSIVSIVGLIFLSSVVPALVWLLVLAGAMLVNFVLAIVFAGSIHDVFNSVSSRSNEAQHYVSLFNRITDFETKSTRLKELQSKIRSTDSAGSVEIARLSKLAGLANIRRNGILFLLYVVLEFLFFWDAHALHWLERWKTKQGHNVQRWFDGLGQWEALCAIAKLAHDEPDWVYPTVYLADGGRGDGKHGDDKHGDGVNAPIIEGTEVGHPLLGTERVPNDVKIGPPGTVLLVTGSNMSGKSTLLRSVGANVVLGQMGSVVCAQTFRQPTMQIETSMRIADSLADGVSFFMAELQRLKQVVDAAEAIQASGGQRRMLFLLDEILQGTNSRERQIAVSRVVRRLIDRNAIGAISTHDLDLAKTDELASACDPVYFSEQFKEVDGKKAMTFDYQMKTGIAETTNALKLLELVGLGDQ